MYYKVQTDNRMALMFEANLKAAPLVAVKFEKKFDLIRDFLEEKRGPANTDVKAKKLEENNKIV